jgi:nicotinamide phosphoribosyltransferase
MNPLLLTDFYKVHHNKMYPQGMTLLYSNFTPRKSRLEGVNSVVFFGLQHFIKKYLIGKFQRDFFDVPLDEIIDQYKLFIDVDTSHIEKLHVLGYLPIEIKALEEGTLCPIGVPCLTIKNTHPDFGWLTNYLETLISCQLWQPITSATIANEYKKLLSKYAIETTGTAEFVQWQGHDFSMRGMSSVESAILSGMGHLTSFTGTDTIPAIYALKSSYNASGLIGASVPATEHSVMCMGQKESEISTFKRLLDLYPTGILSVVSDTWDLWKVCTEYLPQLKEEILKRDGKLVIRPDSGDPVDIICGSAIPLNREVYEKAIKENKYTVEEKGVIELLWDVFGGTTNEQGYKVLDSHIGAIYGDSITLGRAKEICERLKQKGFASTNVVLGIGSYTYQYNTRDTFGFAMKATGGQVGDEWREIFKDPITDDGTKKSKKGLLRVQIQKSCIKDDKGIVLSTDKKLIVEDQCTWEQEQKGLLTTIFKDSKLLKETSLDEIRLRLNKQ